MDIPDSNKNNKSPDIPKYLNIGDYKYSFKEYLVNDRYSYRCFHRACKVLITINKENLLKIIIKNDQKNERIEYSTNNTEHSCIKKG